MMHKSFRNILKIIKSRCSRYFFGFLLIIILIILVTVGVYKTGIIMIRKTIQVTDYLISEEQKRDLARFETKVIMAEEHINELQNTLENIKTGQRVILLEEQKKVLLKITWELRQDSLRIENSLINHQSDWSVNLYPRSDEKIKDKFKNYWPTYILIDRVISDTERVAYSSRGLNKFQVQKLRADIKGLQKIFELRQ